MSGELALGYPTFPRALQIGPAEAECFLSRDDLYGFIGSDRAGASRGPLKTA